ncbi:restriction endonuclease [Streptomyces sioyaensis]|uniref:restriction endonuclease n=1 Tax=Streptomyces sioyaensis TaxID=67364 RepID=UPI00340A16D3
MLLMQYRWSAGVGHPAPRQDGWPLLHVGVRPPRHTQASKGEGVDAVAISKGLILNGECVIQAKRYAKLVGVESVQGLAGVVEQPLRRPHHPGPGTRASHGYAVVTVDHAYDALSPVPGPGGTDPTGLPTRVLRPASAAP